MADPAGAHRQSLAASRRGWHRLRQVPGLAALAVLAALATLPPAASAQPAPAAGSGPECAAATLQRADGLLQAIAEARKKPGGSLTTSLRLLPIEVKLKSLRAAQAGDMSGANCPALVAQIDGEQGKLTKLVPDLAETLAANAAAGAAAGAVPTAAGAANLAAPAAPAGRLALPSIDAAAGSGNCQAANEQARGALTQRYEQYLQAGSPSSQALAQQLMGPRLNALDEAMKARPADCEAHRAALDQANEQFGKMLTDLGGSNTASPASPAAQPGGNTALQLPNAGAARPAAGAGTATGTLGALGNLDQCKAKVEELQSQYESELVAARRDGRLANKNGADMVASLGITRYMSSSIRTQEQCNGLVFSLSQQLAVLQGSRPAPAAPAQAQAQAQAAARPTGTAQPAAAPAAATPAPAQAAQNAPAAQPAVATTRPATATAPATAPAAAASMPAAKPATATDHKFEKCKADAIKAKEDVAKKCKAS